MARQGNGIFHVDSSFNPRRAGYSLLRAHELPPPGTGGNTDVRTPSLAAFHYLFFSPSGQSSPLCLPSSSLTTSILQFADTRHAYDTLPPALKSQLLAHDYVGAHSIWQSRKKAAPADSPWLKDVDPADSSFGRHKLVQLHEPSGRMNLYVANHLHHLETADGKWVEHEEGKRLIEALLEHAVREEGRISVEWKEAGDLVVW